MHRVIDAEQIQIEYDAADRCKRCKEITCKQPAFVEVVFCPRFQPADDKSNTQASAAKHKKRLAKLV